MLLQTPLFIFYNMVLTCKQADYLLQAKKDIEEMMEHEKWQSIANAIEAKSGNKYPTSAVQKKSKELTKKVNGYGVAVAVEEE